MAYTYTNSKGKKYFLHVKKVERASGKTLSSFISPPRNTKARKWKKFPLARPWSS